jgi:hypothetical protein
MQEYLNPGYVFWDVDNDRIIVKTREGFLLSLDGTNIVEAAIYLPRMYKHILSIKDTIPEGIQYAGAKVEGNDYLSAAASPLVIFYGLPNLALESDPSNIHSPLSKITEEAIDKAIKNRVNIIH